MNTIIQDSPVPKAALSAPASLEHLTGPSRGTVSWLNAATIEVQLDTGNRFHIAEPGDESRGASTIARLFRSQGSFEIDARETGPVWINGRKVEHATLVNGDVIEFGERGPISRFHLHRDGRREKRSVSDILEDFVDYLRVSRKPLPVRIWRALFDLSRRLLRDTTRLFRLAIVTMIVILAGLAYQQHATNERLQDALKNSRTRLDQVAEVLRRAQREALRPGDLQALRDELGQRLGSYREQLETLEDRFGATARVIAESSASVALLQGAYGFRDAETGLSLRHAVDAAGKPVVSPFGQPMLTLHGEGPLVQSEYVGTGFMIRGLPVVVSNRHIALPWEGVSGTPGDGLEPFMIRFQAYFPDRTEPIPLEVLKVSEASDLALFRLPDEAVTGNLGLALGDNPPRSGDEVIVIGYPTGLRSLLAQSGDRFIEALQASEDVDFWMVSQKLADAGYISPLASRGIIAKVAPATLVYDAETTRGGSGGPVLTADGRVVAVNAAVIPEFGGSNFGVTTDLLRKLLAEAGYE